jgi:hypothetical protein
MASISRALSRINQDLRPYLYDQSINDACREAGHLWRERKLGPVKTVHLFVLQVLCFNTAMTHLRHLADAAVKAPAYCRARMRLPLAALQKLLRQSSTAMRSRDDQLWCGLKAYLVDGSSTIAPGTPDSQKAFGQPRGCKKGCGFPVPKVLALFDAFNGMIVELMSFALYTHEQSKVWMLHPLLGVGDLLVGVGDLLVGVGDLLVGDRGFCSYAHAAMLVGRGIHGLFRLHQKVTVSFRPHRRAGGKGRPKSRFIRRLGKHDQIVEWLKPASKPKWMSDEQYQALPPTLQIRELRYHLPRKGQRTPCVTIATTLLDSNRYSKQDIAELYNVRWTAETHFAELKTTLKMRKVKSMTSDGVRKELAVYCLAYNLVHAIMLQAAARQGVSPDRISFIDTVRWLLGAQPGEVIADLMINPARPDRHEPRVTKDRQDTYPKMCRPRDVLRKELKKQAKTA